MSDDRPSQHDPAAEPARPAPGSGPLPVEGALPQPFRPLPIRAFNALGRGLARWERTPIDLSEDKLLATASRWTRGLEDFGDERFRPALRVLLDSLERDAKLTLFGRYFARRQVLELLSHRLLLADHRRRHPEVEQEEIRRPIFILGLPRTGTTLLYGLMAEDPAHRVPLSWEVDQPEPPAETPTYETDPRIESTRKRFAQLVQLAPGVQAIHPVGETLPQECIVITASAFLSVRFEMCFDVSTYQDWLLDQDMAPAYEHHRRFLQHMQSRHRCERWLLKSPGHLGPLDALFDAYPDALVIQTHRDPVRVIPSVASLEYTLRTISTDDQDPVRLGRQQLRVWSRLLEQGMASRARHPERESRILDVSMGEIVSDPLACVERIYDHFDLPLSEEARHRMMAYLSRHPKDEHGAHRYSLEAFGLDEATVDETFKGYRQRFGIEREPFGGS